MDMYENNFIIKQCGLKKAKSFLKKAQALPGRCGVANLLYIANELSDDYKLISDLVVSIISSWVKIDGDDFWYIFESRDNTLVNYSEKIFSVIKECDSIQLAKIYRNALEGRSYKYPYPPEHIIQEYLESSIFFKHDEGELTFIGSTTELNDIEKDIVLYLKNNSKVKFPEFRSHLQEKGYGHPHIIKTINSSPLVYVDKSEGRTRYVYSLAGSTENRKQPVNNRYKEYLLRLREPLEIGTDETLTQKARREHRLLQEWLFKDKKKERCAICDNEYSVHTLVTAHKKKRVKCNDAERLDPYIVMPICVIGCDYLYEHKYVYIEDGVIKKGLDVVSFSEERNVINKLVGKKVDERWLRGSSSYFELPSKALKQTSR